MPTAMAAGTKTEAENILPFQVHGSLSLQKLQREAAGSKGERAELEGKAAIK